MPKLIAACMDDLLFLSKIQSAAKTISIEIRALTGTPDDVTALISQLKPSSVLIDLNSKKFDALGVIRSLKTSETTLSIPLVGFFSHVDFKSGELAVAAGCDRVLPRSAFVQKLAEILSES